MMIEPQTSAVAAIVITATERTTIAARQPGAEHQYEKRYRRPVRHFAPTFLPSKRECRTGT